MPLSVVYNMDCVEAMKSMSDKCFDLAIVDPEYGLEAPKMSMGTNRNRKDGGSGVSTAERLRAVGVNTEWDNKPPSPEYFAELFRVSKNQIIFGGNYFLLPPSRGVGIWDKFQSWEVFSQFEYIWTSFDCPAFIIKCANYGGRNDEKKIHVNQKPIKVYNELLRRFAKPGDRIIDTHLGSGSSRIAAYYAGFDFTGYEKDKRHFDDQEERFKLSTAQLNIFVDKP